MAMVGLPHRARDVSLPAFLLFALFFIGIPLAIFLVTTERWLDAQSRTIHQQRAAGLERILAEFDLRTRPFDLLLDRIRFLCRRITSAPDPLTAWITARRTLKADFGNSVGFIWTTPDGEPDPSQSDVVAPPGLIRSFFHDQRMLMVEKKDGFQRNADRYRRFFGPLLGRGREQLWDRLILTSFRGPFDRVYISDWNPGKPQFIVFLRPNPDWPVLIIRQMVGELRKAHPEARLQLRPLRSRKPSDPRMERVLAMGGARAETFQNISGRIWGQMEVSPGLHLIASIQNRPDPSIEKIRHRSREGAFAIGAACVVLGWFLLLGRGVPWVSIRLKLGILFLYVIALPVTLLVFSTQGLLEERRELAISGLHRDHEKLLRNLDDRFNQYLGTLEVALQKLLSDPIAPGPPGKVEAGRRLSRTIDLCRPEMCVLIDEKGSFAFREISEKFVPLFRAVSIVRHGMRGLIGELNNTAGTEGETSEIRLAGATAEYFGLDIDLLFAELSRNLGYLNDFTANNSRLLTFLAPVRETGGRVRFVAMIAWRAELMQWRFVQKHFLRIVERLPGTQGFAFSESNQESWPPDKALKEEIRPYSVPLRNLALPITGRVLRERREWALTGINCRQANRYQFFARSPVDRFSQELTAIRWRYGVLCLVFLLIGLVVGTFLSRSVLEPIGDVAAGVEAIAGRRFDLRIPVASDDEFGRLSIAFNDLLANSEDLELARVIQESFFPSETVVVEGGEVHGACVPATHVGGDFFFYRALSSHQLLMLVGDVSGHGVSAALVVAMARALVTHPDTPQEPEQLLMTMQRVFAATLNRRKMMTCCAALYDSRSCTMKLANAGHNYPLLLKRGTEGEPQAIEATGMPLGSRQRFPFEPVEIPVSQGDWMLFYTDGLLEATDRDGGAIGSNRLTNEIRELRRERSEMTVMAVHEWFTGRVVPGPLPDDVTIVAFQTTGKSQAE